MAEEEKKSPKEMTLWQKLWVIQTQLKSPKAQYNSFGKYSYRSAEDILESLKPFLKATYTVIILGDELEVQLSKVFVKAKATLIDVKDGTEISSTAYAELCEHKGMSLDQCTGTASSYARKYALNALFALNDVKDSDYIGGIQK